MVASHQLLTTSVIAGSSNFLSGLEGNFRGVIVPSMSSLQRLKALRLTASTFRQRTLELPDRC